MEFPGWAREADLMFADAAGWNHPIRFARGVGGHACVRDVAAAARDAGVHRLVFAHIGRPSIRAIDRGERPPFGQWAATARCFGCADPQRFRNIRYMTGIGFAAPIRTEPVMAAEFQGKIALDIRDSEPDWGPYAAPGLRKAHPTFCIWCGTTSELGPGIASADWSRCRP
ncbi:arylsulfatase domain protein [Mycobacterium xenopi 3993]|nr:arylsulfatase domain protein [Mycobacterium xenopi 3993]